MTITHSQRWCDTGKVAGTDVLLEIEASHSLGFTARDRTAEGENVVLHPNPGRQTRVWIAFLDAKHNSLQGRFSVRATVGLFVTFAPDGCT